MKTSMTYITALVAVAGWLAPIHSIAADGAKTTKPAENKPDAMKVATDGFDAMRSFHDARVAIFDGDPKVCAEMLDKASASLAKASKDEAVAKVKGDMIPIDGSMALSDTFVPSAEKAAHIAKANEHFKAGNAKKGLDELKLGEIDVNFSRVLMPLKETETRLAAATSLSKEHKFYEANLALKAAEDGIILDSVSLLDFPNAAGAAKVAPETDTKTEKK